MKFFKYIAIGAMALTGLTACTGDLDLEPIDPSQKLTLTTQEEWDGYFARIYTTLFAGDVLSGFDGGAGSFTRVHFNLQEIVADECFISEKWGDPGYQPLNMCQWGADNQWLYAAYSRESFNVKVCAEFIKAMEEQRPQFYDDAEINSRIAEAKALRALSYYYMIDLFGKGPWVEPASVTGATPETCERADLFNRVVTELSQAITDIKPAAQQEFGRVSREGARALLAKLYLNAEVYTGKGMWAECAQQCQEIVKTINQLAPEYKYLFCATNDKYNRGGGELLWIVPSRNGAMDSWGGATYLTAGCYIETVPKEILTQLNAPDAWSGLRLRPELSKALEGDNRRLIYEGKFKEEIPDLGAYDEESCGYMCIKYTNTTEDDYLNEKHVGTSLNNGTAMSPTAYPIFRLSDVFLMLTECQLHGVSCDGLAYFNKVRARAGMPEALVMPTADQLLHERQVELYMEGHRRSDLIRFGKYTGGAYNWSWKNGVLEGGAIADTRALFPIPVQYTGTIGQNPGY